MLELDGRRRIGKEIVMASQTDRQAGRHAICRNVSGRAEKVVYGLNTTSESRKGYVYDPPYHNLMQGTLTLQGLQTTQQSQVGELLVGVCKYYYYRST